MLQFIKSLQDRKAENGEEGFTLIELLIVIVVLGILAAVVVFTIGNVTSQSASAACNADAKSVETAVAAYNAQNSAGIQLETSQALAGAAGGGTQAKKLIPTYLNAWPSNSGHYALVLAYGGTGALGTAGQVLVYAPTAAAFNAATTVTIPVVYDTQTTNGCNATGI